MKQKQVMLHLAEPPFVSIQGEGMYIGHPAVFIRFSGCNLFCPDCDTKYSWKVSKKYPIKEVVKFIKKSKLDHIVFTGGEPMLCWKDIEKIINSLDLSYLFEIETNGTIPPYDFSIGEINQVVYNVAPKIGSLGMKWISKDILKQYTGMPANFKFVVKDCKDFKKMLRLKRELKIQDHDVYIMPKGKTSQEIRRVSKRILPLIIKHNLRYSPRLQISIWGNKKSV